MSNADRNKSLQIISDCDYIFRNVHNSSYNKWKPRTTPNEANFKHYVNPEDGKREDGLSVSWQNHCSLDNVFILLGLKTKKKGDGVIYLNPKEYKVIKLKVGDIKDLNLVTESIISVVHNPTPNNYGHALICFEEEGEEEIRLKLVDLAASYGWNPMTSNNFDEIIKEIETRKSKTSE